MAAMAAHDMPMPMPGHGEHGGGGAGHGGHGDMDMGHGGAMQCSMSMVWNTAREGMCVVFPSWRVSGPNSLAATLFALFLLAMLLEYLRLSIRRLDARLISANHLTDGILAGLGLGPSGSGAASPHKRKASVQQILNSNNQHHAYANPARSSGISGPTLATSSLGGRKSPSGFDAMSVGSSRSSDDAPLLPGGGGSYGKGRKQQGFVERLLNALVAPLPISPTSQSWRSLLYVVTLALSMFLMLVFMTYNAWLIAAVLTGAGAGHYLFNRDIGLGLLGDERATCH